MYIGVSQLNTLSERNIQERIRRQSAEEAYRKDHEYHERKEDKMAKLLTKMLLEDDEPKLRRRDAGQIKPVHMPLGKSLEETINLWKDVRNEALIGPEPTTADYQLASKASMNIRRTEAQLGLNRQANSAVDAAVHQERQAVFTRMTEEFSTPIEAKIYDQQQKYKRATSAYSFQVQMKLNGFKVNTPSFLKIA